APPPQPPAAPPPPPPRPPARGPTPPRGAAPHAEVGAAVARVRASGGYPGTVLAFEFLVLTAARSAEVRGARWAEIDRTGAVWTIPGERMKAGREHRVPLARGALEVLDEAAERFGGDDPVFPSPTGKVANHSLMPTLLRELEIGAVPHGFRSSFRDWAAECSDAPREVCELALAHVNSDRVEAAYRRTDLFDRRRELMRDWAAYIADAA
ncbi:MAG: site-specific integrase, partial [Alphaproteobacteria bacterium]|nr:site-specific integrase [Alphaproteobacteria bacterium]